MCAESEPIVSKFSATNAMVLFVAFRQPIKDLKSTLSRFKKVVWGGGLTIPSQGPHHLQPFSE